MALSTANPPHTDWTTYFPTYGIADRRFVITVAPQNDICTGKTYFSLFPCEIRSSGRTNLEGSEFELSLETGCLDCVMRDFAES